MEHFHGSSERVIHRMHHVRRYEYLSSVDAALAFAERVLPAGVDMVLKQQTSGKYYHAEYDTEDGDVTAYNHPSLPLAIIAATLTVLISQEPDHDHQ